MQISAQSNMSNAHYIPQLIYYQSSRQQNHITHAHIHKEDGRKSGRMHVAFPSLCIASTFKNLTKDSLRVLLVCLFCRDFACFLIWLRGTF